MYVHPTLRAFTTAFENLLSEVDEEMEDKYVGMFPLRPNRPARGTPSCPSMDGPFEIAPDFTPGIRSKHGRVYRISCLSGPRWW
ncbi:MAG: hypothetical protein LBK73_06080 [Treponema sp.]|nr:hypothetical protein [Treponema sp.]